MSEQELPPPAEATWTVSQVAREAQVAPSAVRFYEQHGLIRGYRTFGNQRRFTAGAACRIKVSRMAQRVGLTVREIAQMFEDMPDDLTCAEWERVGAHLVDSAYARIGELEAALALLGSDTRLCDLDEVSPDPAANA